MAAPTDRYLGNPNLPTPKAEFEWSPNMVKELQLCTDNILHFAEEHFYITSLDKGKIKIPLYKCQKRVMKSLVMNRFVILLASRQIGKTTLMTIYALWTVCFKADQRVLIVANKEDTAIKIFRRIRTAYEMLPNYLKPGVKEWGTTGMILANDSSIGISTTTSDAARGDTCNVLIIDEMASIPYNLVEDFWRSTIPVISSSKTAKIFAVSTPRGTGNKFYEVYTGAERRDEAYKNWKAERVDWWDVPGRDAKWKQIQTGTLGSKEAFDQEFGNVFVEQGQSAIDGSLIEELKASARKPKIILEDDSYKIFKEPITGHIYTIGVDVSEGIGQASSVAQIFDITDLTKIEQVAIYHNNKIDPHTFASKVFMIANNWGRPPLLIERNNCGGQVIDALIHNYQYMNLIDYVPGKTISDIRRGIYSHQNSRYKAIMNMRYWMNTLRVVKVWDIATIQEMETFIRHPNGIWKKKTGEKNFDDRILAMVWALFALEPEVAERHFDVVSIDDKGKPKKILALETAGKESFTLDRSAEVGDYTPMSVYLGVGPGSGPNNEMEELMAQGWKPF